MKAYYSILDLSCLPLLTQPMQHVLNADTAKKQGGNVIFYTAEDPGTLVSQKITKAKLNERPDVDGFIFLHLKQFFYGDTPGFSFLQKILADGYEVHFTREQLSIHNEMELADQFSTLYTYGHSVSQAEHENLKHIIQQTAQTNNKLLSTLYA